MLNSRGIRPAVIAMIASAGISLLIVALFGQRFLPNDLLSFDITAIFIFLIAISVLRIWKLNPIFVMIGSGMIGVLLNFIL